MPSASTIRPAITLAALAFALSTTAHAQRVDEAEVRANANMGKAVCTAVQSGLAVDIAAARSAVMERHGLNNLDQLWRKIASANPVPPELEFVEAYEFLSRSKQRHETTKRAVAELEKATETLAELKRQKDRETVIQQGLGRGEGLPLPTCNCIGDLSGLLKGLLPFFEIQNEQLEKQYRTSLDASCKTLMATSTNPNLFEVDDADAMIVRKDRPDWKPAAIPSTLERSTLSGRSATPTNMSGARRG